jgi:hypothetical protein
MTGLSYATNHQAVPEFAGDVARGARTEDHTKVFRSGKTQSSVASTGTEKESIASIGVASEAESFIAEGKMKAMTNAQHLPCVLLTDYRAPAPLGQRKRTAR